MNSLFNKILVALDYDDALAKPIAGMAATLAQANFAKLKFVTVAPPVGSAIPAASGVHGAPPALGAMETETQEALINRREEFLRDLAKRFQYREKIEHEVRVGAPDEEIVQCAEDCAADMIVLGAHQRGFLDRLFQTSVSGEVARKASCAVLILPEEFARDEPAAAA